MNYDPSQVGVPYVRVHKMSITWPDSAEAQVPVATLEQSLAVKLADGSIRTLEKMQTLDVQLDFDAHGNSPIPLVNPENASSLGADTTLNQTMLAVLAVIRQAQIVAQG